MAAAAMEAEAMEVAVKVGVERAVVARAEEEGRRGGGAWWRR